MKILAGVQRDILEGCALAVYDCSSWSPATISLEGLKSDLWLNTLRTSDTFRVRGIQVQRWPTNGD